MKTNFFVLSLDRRMRDLISLHNFDFPLLSVCEWWTQRLSAIGTLLTELHTHTANNSLRRQSMEIWGVHYSNFRWVVCVSSPRHRVQIKSNGRGLESESSVSKTPVQVLVASQKHKYITVSVDCKKVQSSYKIWRNRGPYRLAQMSSLSTRDNI